MCYRAPRRRQIGRGGGSVTQLRHLAARADGAKVNVPMAPTDAADESLEKSWHREMLDIYESAREIGYIAGRFIQLVSERGPLAAGRLLIDEYDDVQSREGFRKLSELERLSL